MLKQLILALLFLSGAALFGEIIHEQKWDTPFSGKEILLTKNRIGQIPSEEKTPDGEKTIALKILSKPDDTSSGAQLNLRKDADLKKGDRLRLTFWIKGTEFGNLSLNIIQDGKLVNINFIFHFPEKFHAIAFI